MARTVGRSNVSGLASMSASVKPGQGQMEMLDGDADQD